MSAVMDVRRECSYRFCNFHRTPSDRAQRVAVSISDGVHSRWHYVWLIPCNVLANLYGLFYTVASAVCHLLASAVFKVMACCAVSAENKFRYKLRAACHLDGGVDALINDPVLFVTRMIGFMEQETAFCYRTCFGERVQRERHLRDYSWTGHHLFTRGPLVTQMPPDTD